VIVGSWPPSPLNAYLRLYTGALRPHGIVTREIAVNDAALCSAVEGGLDVLHLHWSVEYIWRNRGGLGGRARGLVGFVRFLRLARRLGVKVVWTVHELHPAGDGRSRLDRLGFRYLARAADLCICHDAETRADFLRLYGARPERTVVMPHGNYDGQFPPPAAPAAARVRFGLHPARRTLVGQGLIIPHKGFDVAIEAVRRLGPDYQLLIAGPADDPAYVEKLRAAAAGLPGVVVRPGSLDAQGVADVYAAADAAVLPYRRTTGSGALLTALTMGRGVVAADVRYFRQTLAPEPDAGVLVPGDDPDKLAAAVREFFTRPTADRSAAARRLADRHAWPAVVRPVVDWYARAFPGRVAAPAGAGG
jgi:glycosyltransferase involved in cell wall biosynthesis